MARKSSPTEHKDAKRELLIQSAVTVFAQKGFHAAKIQDIADVAGVGKGTVYEYFSTKDELFLAVYDSWMDKYESMMLNAANQISDPVHIADALIDTTVEFYEQHAEHASILLEFWAHALRSDNPHFIERIRSMKSTLSRIGQDVTNSMKKIKAFTSVDSASFALLELGISDGIFLQWVLDGQTYSLREAYKFRQSVIGAGLMTTGLRTLLKVKTSKRLKKGFLNKDEHQL